MDGKFAAQYDVETSALRPQGKNPADYLYSVAKNTSTSLSTLNINSIGASARLRIGTDNVRRLWRINKNYNKREDISPEVLAMSDGGKTVWNCMNSHLEETALKEKYATTDKQKEYLYKLCNPDNPFSEEPTVDLTPKKKKKTYIRRNRNSTNYIPLCKKIK